MSSKVLEGVKRVGLWNSFMGSVKAVLEYTNMKNIEDYMLMGSTGMAFRFVMKSNCDASGPTVYDWASEHFTMLDRIGIFSDITLLFREQGLNTFKLAQVSAMEKIKKAIDTDIPVIIWAPSSVMEFGIISGYDDEQRVFFVRDVGEDEPDPLLYDNLGISMIPYLYVHVLESCIDVAQEKMFRSSLVYGIKEWNKKFHVSSSYTCGNAAYQSTIDALSSERFNDFGFCYCMAVYAQSKELLAEYIKELSIRSKEIKIPSKTVEYCMDISDGFREINMKTPFLGPKKVHKVDCKKELALYLKQLREKEEYVMKSLEKAIGSAN